MQAYGISRQTGAGAGGGEWGKCLNVRCPQPPCSGFLTARSTEASISLLATERLPGALRKYHFIRVTSLSAVTSILLNCNGRSTDRDQLIERLQKAPGIPKKAGLDPALVIESISKGAAQSWQMENRWQTMVDGEFDFGFAVDWMRKDLGIALEEARKNGSTLALTELVDRFYAEVQAMGGNRWDTSSLIARLETKRGQ